MAWSAQDEAELRKLEAEEQDGETEQKGYEAVDKSDAHRVRPVKPNETRSFSFFRATVGGLRDAAQNVLDFTEDAGNELNKRAPLPGLLFGSDAQNGVVGFGTGEEINRVNARGHKLELSTLKGEENAGTAERVTRGIVSFVAPFAAWSKAFGIAKAGSWLGRAGVAMTAGAATDVMMNPEQTNMANVMRDTFGIDNKLLDSLASEEDDNRLVARFKAAAVNAPLSLATDALFEAGLRGVRAYRAWRGTAEEAGASVHAARQDMKVSPVADEAAGEAPHGASASSSGPADQVAGEAFDPFKHTKPSDEHTFASFEDIVTFFQKKAGLGDVDEELLSRFAENLVDGNPADTLGRLAGINPLKVDFSAMDDPEMLGRLHAGLQEVYEGIASRLGRTGIRVTEQMTARAARAMATSADVLKDLYGRTENLDAIMYASQTVVGAHATKMVGQAEAALKALKSGQGDAEWQTFLEAFHRQAYFLGALRGAGSEVGRALKSLQHIQKIGRTTATRDVKAAVDGAEKNAKAAAKAGGAQELATTATDTVSAMASPAERILFLSKLVDKSGDLGDLSRFTRTKSGSILHRLDSAIGETRGNLFSSATAVTNVLSGMTIMGLRGTSMLLSSLKAVALSPFGKTYSQAARVQALTTWAYVDGALGGWRAAFHNTMSLLEREGMEEVVLNADAWNAKGLAKKAAGLADEGRLGVKGNFERVDISNRERAFVMNESDMRSLNETIQSWNTPALMEHSMKFLLKAIRPGINALGSASRLGTILFVNGADQFAGTIAARAGAQAEAMRIGAHEAAELGLEGKALGDYMRARMVQLTETVDGFADDAYSAGQHEAALSAGEIEAKGALFQDDLEFGALRAISAGMSRTPFLHLLVPFVKTPLRILERTAIDYTPLGLLKDRMRADIMAGGARRDQTLASIGLGTLLTYTAFQMAEDRRIVGQDGDYQSSARLNRPSYSLRVGDDVVEFKRFDPMGTLLGLGADIRAYLDHQEEIPPEERSSVAGQMIEAVALATSANVLSKTWLTSLRDLTKLASDTIVDGQGADGWAHYLQSFATRFVPASGIQRSLTRGAEGADHEAAGFIEGIMRQSIGAPRLPVKRDGILGRPVPVESGDRLFGIKSGPGASDIDDPVGAEMERLSFDIGKPSRSFHGVRLTSAQYNRFLELRGQVVTKASTGLTLEGALGALIKLPEYQALPRAGKVQAIRDETRGYTEAASSKLVQEDPELARKVARNQVWDKALLEGTSQADADSQTAELFKALGLSGDQTNTNDQ